MERILMSKRPVVFMAPAFFRPVDRGIPPRVQHSLHRRWANRGRFRR